jgi:hypothetical protein
MTLHQFRVAIANFGSPCYDANREIACYNAAEPRYTPYGLIAKSTMLSSGLQSFNAKKALLSHHEILVCV